MSIKQLKLEEEKAKKIYEELQAERLLEAPQKACDLYGLTIAKAVADKKLLNAIVTQDEEVISAHRKFLEIKEKILNLEESLDAKTPLTVAEDELKDILYPDYEGTVGEALKEIKESITQHYTNAMTINESLEEHDEVWNVIFWEDEILTKSTQINGNLIEYINMLKEMLRLVPANRKEGMTEIKNEIQRVKDLKDHYSKLFTLGSVKLRGW